MLQRVFGVSDYAIATVLAAFFLGLGLGSALGGRFADRLRKPAWAYAGLEVGIGLWAIFSLLLIPNLHGTYAFLAQGVEGGSLLGIRLLLALGILLPPTIMMGATLPILVRVVAAGGGDWSKPATSLYATNTLGAMAGAGVTGFYFLPELGNRASVVIAAGLSIVGALLVFGIWSGSTSQAPEPSREPAEEEPETYRDRPAPKPESGAPSQVRLAATLAGCAGFAALASEVLWTRALRIVAQGTTLAFSSMLVVYLAGIAIGSLLAPRLLSAFRISAGRLFGLTQMLLAALTLAAMALAPQLPRVIGLVNGSSALDATSAGAVFAIAALLLFPIALALGTSIPLAWRIAGGTEEEAARHAGTVLAWNTIGGLLGSLTAGFVMIPILGLDGSLVFGVLFIHGIIAIAAYLGTERSPAPRILGLAVSAGVVAVALLLQPSVNLPFLLHARSVGGRAIIEGSSAFDDDSLLLIEEGRNTTVTVLRQEGILRLYNDGRPESGIAFEKPYFGAELAALGAMPGLFADERERALVVGLGGGHTTTMLLAGGFQTVDVVELEGAVVNAARFIHQQAEVPFPLDDPRAELIVDDARARLNLSPAASYDAVVSQPSHPWLAGSSALYTEEFFHEVARALKPGGVFSLWVNLFRAELVHIQRVAATLLEVFPHANAYLVEETSFILVASDAPFVFDDPVRDRLDEETLQAQLEPLGLERMSTLFGAREFDTVSLRAFAGEEEVLTDDRPSLEFELAQLAGSALITPERIDLGARDIPWLDPATLESLAIDPGDAVAARVEKVRTRRHALERLELVLPDLALTDDQRRYVEGTIHEARGQRAEALAAYDASDFRSAAMYADQLRFESRAFWRVLQTATARETVPWSAGAIVESALAVQSRPMATRAVAVARAAQDPEEEDLVRVAEAWIAGCDALLRHPSLAEVARESEHVAFVAVQCALDAGYVAVAQDYQERWATTRRTLSREALQRGNEAQSGGLTAAAAMLFRQALETNPTNGAAAAQLARILAGWNRSEAAAAILQRTHVEARALPAASMAIEATAAELGIALRDPD